MAVRVTDTTKTKQVLPNAKEISAKIIEKIEEYLDGLGLKDYKGESVSKWLQDLQDEVDKKVDQDFASTQDSVVETISLSQNQDTGIVTVSGTLVSPTTKKVSTFSYQFWVDASDSDISDLRLRIMEVEEVVPPEATRNNQLADKDYVNTRITQLTARRVSSDEEGNPFLTRAALLEAKIFYYEGELYTPQEHDYALVVADEDAPVPFTNGQTRFEYTGETWTYAYGLNTGPFTRAEMEALESGITKELTESIPEKYVKPEDGIPYEDLTEDIQASLDLADTSVQEEVDPTVHEWAKAETKPTYTKDEIGLDQVDNTSDADKPISTATQDALDTKVDKIEGKGLSTEDYTTEDKTYVEETVPQEIANLKTKLTNLDTSFTESLDEAVEKLNESITEVSTTLDSEIVSATAGLNIRITNEVQTLDDSKQDKEDQDLNTFSKTVVGSINEILNLLEELTDTVESGVLTVNGRVGNVVLTKTDVYLDQVDNTSDADKPISTATQAALDNKVDKIEGMGLSAENYTSANKTAVETTFPTQIYNLQNRTAALEDEVDSIEELIPNEATSSNQLADKAYVNNAVQYINANKVTYNAEGDSFPSREALLTATVFYSEGVEYEPERNDYTIVLKDEEAEEPYTDGQTRWEFDGTQWTYAYGLGRGFTEAEELAIDSGVTANDVSLARSAYQKPSAGIPYEDLAAEVQVSLDKADTAVQEEVDPTVPDWAKAATKPTYTKDEVGLGNVDNTSDADKPISTATQTALDTKVDKITGKGLSTEDFTSSEKTYLDQTVPREISDAKSRIDALENYGHFIGAYPTLSSLPDLASEVENGAVVGDYAVVESDSEHNNSTANYIIVEISEEDDTITWQFNFLYSTDTSGKVDKVTGVENYLAAFNSEGNIKSSRITISDYNTLVSDLEQEVADRKAADTTLQSNIDEEAVTREARDTILTGSISSEEEARKAADETLQANINTEISNREAGDASVQANLDLEVSNREAADTTLQSNLDTEASERKAADDTLTTNLTTETSERKSADEDLQSQIDTETTARETLSSDLTEKISEEASAREAVDTTLQTNIDNEESARITADNSLQNSLNTEITDRQTADNTLQANINSEATARETADTNLQAAIDDLADELESDYSTTEEVEAMISSGTEGLATETYVNNKVNSEASERSSADSTLQGNIDSEANARSSADTTLQNNIIAEETARAAADTALQNSITTEETARAAADTALQADINTKVDGISLVFDDNYDLTLSYTKNGATTKLDSINLPLQTLIVDGYQDDDPNSETYGDVILELFNGETIVIKWDAFVEGLVNKDTFDSTVTDLQGQITTVSGDLSSLSNTVSGLSSDLSTLSGTVSGHTTSISSLEGRVSDLEEELGNCALDSKVVHLAGTETITGSKTFNNTITGSISGNAATATTLATARTIQTNLASTSTASFDGSANITPGVTGTLPVANGGTGATSLSSITVGTASVANSTTGTLTLKITDEDSNVTTKTFNGASSVSFEVDLSGLEGEISAITSDLTNNYYDKDDISSLLTSYQVSGNYAKTDASNTFSGSGTDFSQTISGDDPRLLFKDTDSEAGSNQMFAGFSSGHQFGIGDNISGTVKWLIYAKPGDFYSDNTTQPIPRIAWEKTGDGDKPIYFGSDGIPVACDYTLGNMCSKSITTPSSEAYVKITTSGTLTSVTSVASEATSTAAGFMSSTHYNTLEDWRKPYWAEVGGTTITGYDKNYSWSTGSDFAYQVSIPYSDHGKGGNTSKTLYIPSVRCYQVSSSSKISAIDCDYDINPSTGDITIYADSNLNLLVIIV